MNPNHFEHTAFIGLFCLVSVILFFIFQPFIQILTLAAVLAIVFNNSFEQLTLLLRGYRSAASAIIVLIVLVFIIVPLLFLGWQILLEAQNVYQSGGSGQFLQTIQNVIQVPIQKYIPGFRFDLTIFAQNTLAFISGNLAFLVSQAFFVLLDTFLMLLVFFFFLRDGERLLAYVRELSPFKKEHTEMILSRMHHAVLSVVRGTFVVALIRWLLISCAFYLFGIQNATLWGSIGGIVGALPGLGTPFVFIPAILALYLQGNVYGALGLLISAIAIIVLVDNILSPYFFSQGLEVSAVFVLLAMLGGIIFLGPLGFVLGPLILSMFLALIHIYSKVGAKDDST